MAEGEHVGLSQLIVSKGRLIDQSPVHLYDPVTDYVNGELQRRSDSVQCGGCCKTNVKIGLMNTRLRVLYTFGWEHSI